VAAAAAIMSSYRISIDKTDSDREREGGREREGERESARKGRDGRALMNTYLHI